MRGFLLVGVAGLAMGMVTPAMAESEGHYFAGDIGYHEPSSEADACLGATCIDADMELGGDVALFGRVGTHLNSGIRIEAELGQRWGQVDSLAGTSPAVKIDFDATSLMANALYDFGSGRVRPFVGAGLGWVWARYDDGTNEADDSAFAWQLLAGLAMPIGERGNIDLTYRYLSAGDMTFDDGTGGVVVEGDFTDHAVTVGYRRSF